MPFELLFLLAAGLFVIGFCCCIFKFSRCIDKSVNRTRCRHRLKGKVENVVVPCGGPGWNDCQRRLCYTYNDRFYKVVIKKEPRPLKIGDEVDIFIDPDYPADYRFPSDEELAKLDE